MLIYISLRISINNSYSYLLMYEIISVYVDPRISRNNYYSYLFVFELIYVYVDIYLLEFL